MSNDLYNRNPSGIILYGTSWCPDCSRARHILNKASVAFTDIDIESDPQALDFVKLLNNGNQSVPTIVFPDGEILVEPATNILRAKIGAPQQ